MGVWIHRIENWEMGCVGVSVGIHRIDGMRWEFEFIAIIIAMRPNDNWKLSFFRSKIGILDTFKFSVIIKSWDTHLGIRTWHNILKVGLRYALNREVRRGKGG